MFTRRVAAKGVFDHDEARSHPCHPCHPWFLNRRFPNPKSEGRIATRSRLLRISALGFRISAPAFLLLHWAALGFRISAPRVKGSSMSMSYSRPRRNLDAGAHQMAAVRSTSWLGSDVIKPSRLRLTAVQALRIIPGDHLTTGDAGLRVLGQGLTSGLRVGSLRCIRNAFECAHSSPGKNDKKAGNPETKKHPDES